MALRAGKKQLFGITNPFLGWMRTEQYIWTVRLIGLLAIAMTSFAELCIFRILCR